MIFRYVPHAYRDAYLALGWVEVPHEPDHHSVYSVYMKWVHASEPKEPPRDS